MDGNQDGDGRKPRWRRTKNKMVTDGNQDGWTPPCEEPKASSDQVCVLRPPSGLTGEKRRCPLSSTSTVVHEPSSQTHLIGSFCAQRARHHHLLHQVGPLGQNRQGTQEPAPGTRRSVSFLSAGSIQVRRSIAGSPAVTQKSLQDVGGAQRAEDGPRDGALSGGGAAADLLWAEPPADPLHAVARGEAHGPRTGRQAVVHERHGVLERANQIAGNNSGECCVFFDRFQ